MALIQCKYKLLIIAFVLIICIQDAITTTKIHRKGFCATRGSCKHVQAAHQPCEYNDVALPLADAEAVSLYRQMCPGMINGDEIPLTCCVKSQIIDLANNLKAPSQFLSRCPSCYYNLANLFCHTTCSPDQSTFVSVESAESYGNRSSVTGFRVTLSPQFASGMYNNCKDVQNPGGNTKAISYVCGAPADQCNASVWLTYMGSMSNGYAPSNIKFNLTDKADTQHNETSLNPPVIPCSKGINNNTHPCSCLDCAAVCPPFPPIPSVPPPFELLGKPGIMVIIGILFVVFVVFFMTGIIVSCCLRARANNSEGDRILLGPEVVKPNMGCLQIAGNRFHQILKSFFTRWGTLCAKYPHAVILAGFVFVTACSLGILKFQVTTDPVELWSAPDSEARKHKDYFDNNFGPFYRTEQVIIRAPSYDGVEYITTKGGKIWFSGIYNMNVLMKVFELQQQITNLKAVYWTDEGEKVNISLSDVCYKPLDPFNSYCTIQSVPEYFQVSIDNLKKEVMDDTGLFVAYDFHDHLNYCFRSSVAPNDTLPLGLPCLSKWGGPTYAWTAVGGFDLEKKDYENATAHLLTFIVNNHVNKTLNKPAEAWEAEYVRFMKNYTAHEHVLNISFSSERSIEDEINRQSDSDIVTIGISYLLMFCYVALALGEATKPSRLLVDSKITVGLFGVLIVIVAVTSSIGLFSYMGVPATLIIVEVVPFLVLAVGVDNIFILVQAYQRSTRLPVEARYDHIGRVFGGIAPSMLLTTTSESVAFFLGGLIAMPAVKTFSLYAGMALFIAFLLQITVFVSFMAIDAQRQESNRVDICCCVKMGSLPEKKTVRSNGFLYDFVKNYYAPFLLNDIVRVCVIIVFTTWLAVCGCLMTKVEVGLDQSLSMPRDSFVLDYFHALKDYLSVGPPVYFVVENGQKYTTLEGQNEICGSIGCNNNSLIQQLFEGSLISNYSRIAQTPSSWIDDYFDWSNPIGLTPCCRVYNDTGKFCNSTTVDPKCVNCRPKSEKNKRPSKEQFMKYLPFFLEDIPNAQCGKGGHAAYAAAVKLLDNDSKVGATYFMSYHTVVKDSADYIGALEKAQKYADNITKAINSTDGHKVFPYSVFYVFYDQYVSLVHDAIINLSICIFAIFIVTFCLLGLDFFSALIIVISIIMILINMFGGMYLWNISFNAISLVNLIMAVGIGVEFCSHIARAFAVCNLESRAKRAQHAVSEMGSSVLSGIFLTKVLGVTVLAFSKSQLFQVFYFRMYLLIVIFGAAHGLIFLPVFLSYVGPSPRVCRDDTSMVDPIVDYPDYGSRNTVIEKGDYSVNQDSA